MIPATATKDVLHRCLLRDEAAKRVLLGTPGEAGMVKWQDAWLNPSVDWGIAGAVITPPTDFDSPNSVHLVSFWGVFLFVGEGPAMWIAYLKQHPEHTLKYYGLGGNGLRAMDGSWCQSVEY